MDEQSNSVELSNTETIKESLLEPLEQVSDPVLKPLEPVTEPVLEPLEPVTEPLLEPLEKVTEPVLEPLEQVIEPVSVPVLEPLEPVTEPVLKPLEPVTEPVSVPVLEPLEPVTEPLLEPLEPVIKQVLEPLEQVTESVTEPLSVPVLEPLEPLQSVIESVLESVTEPILEIMLPVENVVEKLELSLPLVDPVLEQVTPVENVTNLPIEEQDLKPINNPILDEIQLESGLVTIDISDPPKSNNTLETINKLANDQDTMQRMNVSIQVLLEMYRVITSSLLILFVPQICDDHICTTTENLVWETSTYNTALCFNFISMAFLVNMYYLELVRENRLIKYLSINPELANDNEEVSKQLQLLPVNKQNKIFSINKYYRLSAYVALGIYVLNVMLSASAVNRYYAGSQTTSTFVTYVLFIATKFGSVKTIVSTDKNIFYSAYLIGKVQFNDVDEDNKITK
jgi:uncharacterized protein YggT (Ycf19 family)